MSHEININKETGKASVFVVKDPAWHGLGQVLENPANAEEALVAAGLDWEVEKRPLYYNWKKDRVKIENKNAILRLDTGDLLGIVGAGYTPIQNKESFSFFDHLVSAKEAIYHAAGALGKGERTWILAKLPTDIVIGKEDLVENYVLIYNSHDGSTAITAMMTPIRVVCNNTLTAALNGTGNRVYIRHTKNAEERLREAHKVLGLANKYRVEIESAFNIMAVKNVSEELVQKFLSRMFDDRNAEGEIVEKSKRTKDAIIDIFNSSVGGQDLSTCRGKLFGLYNAAVFYEDNVANFKDENSRLYGTWFGNSKAFRTKAFDVAMELAS